MFCVGLTGGIGSGKTTVAKLFAEKGVNIIDADVIAREITQGNHPALQEIAAHFGKQIIVDGQLDRRQLREIIFTKPDERKWLEQLLHPIILKEIAARAAEPTSFYHMAVIPLLFESGAHDFLQRVVLVDCPKEIQIARATARDQSHSTQIQAIIDAQMPRDERKALADDIIMNETTLESLSAQVDRLHAYYLELATA